MRQLSGWAGRARRSEMSILYLQYSSLSAIGRDSISMILMQPELRPFVRLFLLQSTPVYTPFPTQCLYFNDHLANLHHRYFQTIDNQDQWAQALKCVTYRQNLGGGLEWSWMILLRWSDLGSSFTSYDRELKKYWSL